MRHIYKRLLLSLTLIASSQVTTTYATNIRIVGPDGVSQTPVTSPEGISAANSEPSRFYGPTTAQETLWSISSRLRPSPSVSVQQTLLAIYRLNPQAFEDQNIHKLLPNSNLRIPSLSQVQSRTTETAIEIMDAHTKKLAQVPVAPPIAPKLAPVPQAVPKPVAPEPTPAPKAAVAPKPTTAPKAVVTEQKPAVAVSTPDSSEVIKLESELKSSQSELLSLEEKNHQLRLLLSNVQLEVDQLKEDISDKDRIRTEVERQLEIERNKQLEMESLKPSSLDNALSNNWLLAALACIPGLLAALAGMLILNRRNRNDESENSAEPVNAVPAEFFKEQESLGDEISLDDIAGDEDLLGDELLVDDLVENPIDSEVEEDDIFAGLDDDLDFNLDDEDDLFASIGDDGELDTELDSEFDNIESSNSGISVKGDDKALGLEEMERALDDASANNDNLVGFELSEDNVISNDEIEALLSDTKGNDPLETDEIEQSLLDDLFASAQEPDAQPSAVDKAIEQEEPEAFDEDLDVSDVYELADNLNSAVEDDIDAIFAQVAQEKAQSEGVDSTSNVELTDQSTDAAEVAEDEATVDDLFEEALLNLDDTSANELELDDNSTELLDELLAEEDSDLTSLELDEQALDNLELDDNSTELLDELLEAEDSSLDSLIIDEQAFDNLELDDNSTELLDELLDVEDSGLGDVALDDNSAELLDELLDVEDSGLSNVALDDNSAELLDELLDIEDSGLSDVALDDNSAELLDELLDIEDSGLSDVALDDNNAELLDELLDVEDSGLSDVALDDSSAEPQNELLDNTDSGVEKSALDESSFETLDLESLEHDNKAFDDLAPEPSNLDASPLENSVEDSSAELLDESPKQEASPLSAAIENEFGIPQDEDWQIDESDLPHYNEEDAQFDLPDAAEIEAPQAPVAENNKVEIDDSQLPEYSEDEAFAENAIESLLSDAGEALGEQEVETNHNDIQVSDYNDQDALHDLFSSNIENETPLETPISEDKPSEDKTFNESIQPDAQLDDSDNGQLSSADIIDEFDEKTLNTLLSEPAEGEFAPPHRTHAFDGQDIDSAGMDIDAMLDMGGEDWNGFSLSDEQKSTIDNEVPEDEQSAWLGGEKPAEAIVQAEDWAQQADFESQKEQFMTIDELMAQVELGEEKGNLDDEELNLDVGLNEFPDVIGNADGVDVDNNAEAAGKLDLAKIYMEMNDNTGAIKLLEAAIVDGDDMIRREAKNLIDTINRA